MVLTASLVLWTNTLRNADGSNFGEKCGEKVAFGNDLNEKMLGIVEMRQRRAVVRQAKACGLNVIYRALKLQSG